MSIILPGISTFIVFMIAVMGVPFVRYFKRDMKWEALKNKSADAWYSLD